jgi:hypothetical protein
MFIALREMRRMLIKYGLKKYVSRIRTDIDLQKLTGNSIHSLIIPLQNI